MDDIDMEIDLRSVLGILQRQGRLIALVVAVGLGLAGLVLLAVTPIYSATALIKIEPGRRDLLTSNSPLPSLSSESAQVDGEVELVRSQANLASVVEKLDLAGESEFSPRAGLLAVLGALSRPPPPLAPGVSRIQQEAIERLREAVTIKRRGQTFLIAVEARSKHSWRAAEIANGLAQAHINAQVEARVAATLDARDVVAARLDTAGAQLAVAQKALEAALAGATAEGGDPAGYIMRTDLAGQPARDGGEIEGIQAWQRLIPPTEPASPPAPERLYALQQAAAIARAQYQTLLERLTDLETQSFLQIPESRLAVPAVVPLRSAWPNVPLSLALAGVLSLGLGGLLAVLRESFIGGFTSEAQMAAILRLPVISSVPREKIGVGRAGSAPALAHHADLVTETPLSQFAESVRRLRIGIDQAIRRHRIEVGPDTPAGKVVMITSANAGEGKSTLALALARTYALSGTSTLLIDCDLRQPDIHNLLGRDPLAGLLDYLSPQGDPRNLTEILTIDAPSGARIAQGARPSQQPTDQLMAGQAFTRLLDAATRSFDIVILDTPPIRTIVDGLYLASHADVVALVVRWASTSQTDVRQALAALEQAKMRNTPILTVLSQHDSPTLTSGPKYSGYYVQT